MNDWMCPYCKKMVRDGEHKLRHLAKHEPAVRKMLRKNLFMSFEILELQLKLNGG